MTTKKRIIVLAIGLFAVTFGVLARQPIRDFIWGKPETTTPEVKLPPPSNPIPSAREIAKPHLTWAEQETERVIDEHIRALDGFFSDSKKNTPAFARDALDWESKWNLIKDFVPFTEGGKHENYIRERFEKHIFTPASVEQAVRQVVESYLREVKSIEGTMLVRIKADVSDFPAEYPIATLDKSRLEQIYGEAIQHAIDAAKNDAAAGASLEVVSIIVGEVLTQVAVELSVSAGILGAGAALSWETLGIGLVVGMIVDVIVSWVWDWWKDPKGELAAKVNTKLDEIHRLIVEGSQKVVGLRVRLREVARERTRVRETAVISVLKAH